MIMSLLLIFLLFSLNIIKCQYIMWVEFKHVIIINISTSSKQKSLEITYIYCLQKMMSVFYYNIIIILSIVPAFVCAFSKYHDDTANHIL